MVDDPLWCQPGVVKERKVSTYQATTEWKEAGRWLAGWGVHVSEAVIAAGIESPSHVPGWGTRMLALTMGRGRTSAATMVTDAPCATLQALR